MEMLTTNRQIAEISNQISGALDQLLSVKEDVDMIQEIAEDLFPSLTELSVRENEVT